MGLRLNGCSRSSPSVEKGQAAAAAADAVNLPCRYDEQGNCVEVDPCSGDYWPDYQDDCLAETEKRGWSSPVFVEYREAS